MTLDLMKLDKAHQPNTPRTHDGQGHKIEEQTQCRKCLQRWPCEVHQLLVIIAKLETDLEVWAGPPDAGLAQYYKDTHPEADHGR